MEQILTGISDILEKKIVGNAGASRIDACTRLLSSGLCLDSVAILELIMEVEAHFGVEFTDEELSVELLDTVGALAASVERKLNGAVSNEGAPLA